MCFEVLPLDKSIRYVGLADHLGKLISTVYKPGLVPLCTREKTEAYTMLAMPSSGWVPFREAARCEGWKMSWGDLRTSSGRRSPLVSATQDKFYLLLSIDLGFDAISIIENKVLPQVEKSRTRL